MTKEIEFINFVHEVFSGTTVIIETTEQTDEYRKQFIDPIKESGIKGLWRKLRPDTISPDQQ